jgi:hypothetical protein
MEQRRSVGKMEFRYLCGYRIHAMFVNMAREVSGKLQNPNFWTMENRLCQKRSRITADGTLICFSRKLGYLSNRLRCKTLPDQPSGEIGAHPVRIRLPEARRILVFLSRKDVVADSLVCRGLRGS